MKVGERYAELLVSRAPVVVLVVLALSGVVVAGSVVGDMGGEASVGNVQSDSEEATALDRIDREFATDNGTVAQIVVEGDDALSKDALLATLRLQRDVREDETVEPTLQDGSPTVGFANLVAAEAIRQDAANGPPGGGEGPPSGDGSPDDDGAAGNDTAGPRGPSLEASIEQLESMSDEEVDAVVDDLLAPDYAGPGDPYQFLPNDYDPGEDETATARTLFVFQQDLDDDTIQESQVTIDRLADDRIETAAGDDDETADTGDDDGTTGTADDRENGTAGTADLDRAFVFGTGIVNAESSQALQDSFLVLLPVAGVLVVAVFTLAYRDPVDIVLGVVGIGLVLGWMAGVMGWLGLPNSQLLIAVPFLLIGLAIDYSLHVIMRYREARAGGASTPSKGMVLGLAGVIGALAAATVSTGVGFLSNVTSSIPAIQDFAVISAAGIVATLIVFGSLIPALKVVVDGWLERIGAVLAGRGPDPVRGRPTAWLHRLLFARDKRAIGTGGGAVGGFLSRVVSVSRRAPIVILVLALLLAAAGGAAATDIDTEFNRQDFLPEEPPEWTASLPGPLATGEYEVRQNAEIVSDRFDSPSGSGDIQLLIENDDAGSGGVTDPATLRAIDRARTTAADRESVRTRADETVSGQDPLTVMEATAANDEEFGRLWAASTDEDGVPEENVTELYDALYERNPDAAGQVLARNDDGEYTALRVTITVRGDSSAQTVRDDGQAIAATVDDVEGVTAIATGSSVLNGIVQDNLLDTLVEAFVITVVVILVFLTALYWWKFRAPDVGVITIVPVLLALAWLLGAMWYLDIPFNSETAVITSLAIGLGVDYSIHLAERIVEEADGTSIDRALDDAIRGTGGALLGSASTTAAGFAVLSFALVPPIRRFGTVTALSIVFAYLACLTVLPSLFVLRARVFGMPGHDDADDRADGTAPAAADEPPATDELTVADEPTAADASTGSPVDRSETAAEVIGDGPANTAEDSSASSDGDGPVDLAEDGSVDPAGDAGDDSGGSARDDLEGGACGDPEGCARGDSEGGACGDPEGCARGDSDEKRSASGDE